MECKKKQTDLTICHVNNVITLKEGQKKKKKKKKQKKTLPLNLVLNDTLASKEKRNRKEILNSRW